MESRLRSAIAAAAVGLVVAAGSTPAMADDGDRSPRLDPTKLDRTIRAADGSVQVKVSVRPWGNDSDSRIVARQGKTRKESRNAVWLGPGIWKVTRTATAYAYGTRSFIPNPGQCEVFNTDPELYSMGVACTTTEGGTLQGSVWTYSDLGGFLAKKPRAGTDLAALIADPTYWESYGLPSKKTITLSGEVGPPVTLRDTSTVRVVAYNPGCVNKSEYQRLRIGMSKGEWHRIIGGRGSFENRAAGVEVRSYRGCSWSGPNYLAVRFENGEVAAWAR